MNPKDIFKRKTGRLALWLVLLALVVAPVVVAAPVRTNFVNYTAKVSTEVLQATADGQSTSFIIFLDDQADLSAAYNMQDQDARGWYVYNTLKEHAALTQAPIRDLLNAQGVAYTSYWAANMIITEGDRELVDAVAARPDVRAIESNEVTDWIQDGGPDPDGPDGTDDGDSPDSPEAVDATTPGVNNVNAPQIWNLGFTGQGIVVANQDTGMRWTHTAIRTKYRGWISGTTADHNYNWWDSIHVQLAGDGGTASPVNNPCGRNIVVPCDDQGHGTHTTGTIVGDDFGVGGTGTNQIGVAPGAKWIGCRNMDQGNGRPSTYSECFQFFIAPTDVNGLNPDPTKRPHVMNNSWGCPPSELCAANTLKTIVENTEAAGIFVVASAGNDGPNCSTVQDPPAIYNVSFSVGAINGTTNALTSFSSRGPVTVDGSGRMKPEIVAPGQTVRSSLRTNDTAYGNMSGTSMAGPHVVGVVALLWSARPNLNRNIAATKQLLISTANPNVTVPNNAAGCGGIGSIPNNHFGYGRIDVLAAYNADVARDQTITFPPIADRTYGDADFDAGATASSNLPVSYSASGNCAIVGGLVHITGAGSCTVTASQPGDSYYYAAPNVARSFAIAKANQTITFGALANKLYTDPDFSVTATASSGLAVSFSASGSCTVSGNTVHLTNGGSCALTASQPGDANYNPAPSVVQSFLIFLDDFNRANGALGNNWAGAVNISQHKIASNRVDVQQGGPLYWKPGSFGADQQAFVILSQIDPNSTHHTLVLKAQNGDVFKGAILVSYDARHRLISVEALKPGPVQDWKLIGTFPLTLVNGDMLRAEALADGKVRVYVNATLVGTLDTVPAVGNTYVNKGGSVGLWYSDAYNALFDNFGGGPLVP